MLEKTNQSQFLIRFKKNKRGLVALVILSFLFITSLFAEIIANDKPLLLWFDGKISLPIIQEISELDLDGELRTIADFRDPYVVNLIDKKGWMLMPVIEFSYDTINFSSQFPAPSPPNSTNLLGTDDQGRDVLARLIYGIRVSLIFAILLSLFSAIIAIFLGAIQGYFAGITDIALQRFSEIWSSLPMMFLLIIFSAIIAPSFFSLLFIMMIFSWMSLSSIVRAEFLRLRNFEFVMASRALGAGSFRIIFKHILPNASAVIIANLPFLVSGALGSLTALDFLGFGLPVGSASLGEILAQGKNNIQAYWLGISGFVIITIILSSLVFVGEAIRDGFDSRK